MLAHDVFVVALLCGLALLCYLLGYRRRGIIERQRRREVHDVDLVGARRR